MANTKRTRKPAQVKVEVKSRSAKVYDLVPFEVQVETARCKVIQALRTEKARYEAKSREAKKIRAALRKMGSYTYLGAFVRHQPIDWNLVKA